MKLNYYIPTDTPQRIGGEKNIHFKFISNATERKHMKKKLYKKKAKYMKKHPLLKIFNLDARKCQTLTECKNGTCEYTPTLSRGFFKLKCSKCDHEEPLTYQNTSLLCPICKNLMIWAPIKKEVKP